jgi:hypothetical protein
LPRCGVTLMYGQADVTKTFSGKRVSPTNRSAPTLLKLL